MGPVRLKVGRWKLSENTNQKHKAGIKTANLNQEKKVEEKVANAPEVSPAPPEIRLHSSTPTPGDQNKLLATSLLLF